jgi:DNA polymerase III subunit delta
VSWTPQSLEDTIKREEIYPIYFFYGDEAFLIDDAVLRVTELGLGDGLRDFNYTSFYGDDADPIAVRDAIETYPMMAETRVVVLKEAQDLSDKEWEQLMPVIENPVESCVFICTASKVDKRKKHIKRILETGVVVEFKRPYDNQVPDWIRTIAKRMKLKIDNEAVTVLHQLVGSNLTDIHSELLKLGQYLGDSNVITAEDVTKVVSRVRVDSVFELTDAIGSNDRGRALANLANLIEHGQNEVGVLALVSRHVRILQLVNDGLKQGLSGQRLSQHAGVSPFFLKAYVEQSRHWNKIKIERTFRALLDTDRALKSSPVAPPIWLENLIIQTCQ